MAGSPSSSIRGGFPLGLAGATAATRYVGATATGAPLSGTFAVGDFVIDQTGKIWVCSVAGTPGTWVQAGGSSITTVDATLGANVTIVNANSFTDGPSGSFVAGTWLITWKVLLTVIVVTSQTYQWAAKLWDGATVYDEGESDAAGVTAGNENSWSWAINGQAIVTLGSTTTLKVSVACLRGSSASQISRETQYQSAASHTASRLSGIKIA